jgi:protein-disulfide isomerase
MAAAAGLAISLGLSSLVLGAAEIDSRLPDEKKRSKKKKKPTRPVLGKPKAKVTIVVFGDIQCPFTKRLLNTLRTKVLPAYSKKVKIEWADFPLGFHRMAAPAAHAGREVFVQKGSKAFWAYLDRVFKSGPRFTRSDIVAAAKSAGADGAKVQAAMSQKKHEAHIKASIARGKGMGVRGTPCMFVNGIKLAGAQPYDKIKTAITGALIQKMSRPR